MRGAITIALLWVLPWSPLSGATAQPANKYAIAVIIGNKNYEHERVPDVDYAFRDAEAMKRYVIDVLGYDAGNVFDLRDADQSQLASYFGKEGNYQGLLWRYIDPRGRSDVLVFYSGHGVPGQKDKRGYLLPVNANPNTAEINGFPVDVLYANLAKLKTKSMTVLLEACFSGDSAAGMLIRSASPVYVTADMPAAPKNMTVLTAAGAGQLASWDDERKYGLFTDRFLTGAYGAADADQDGKVTLAEMREHLADTMTVAARRRYGRIQDATVIGADGAVLAALPGGKAQIRAKLEEGSGSSADGTKTAAAAPPPKPAVGLRFSPGDTFKDCGDCPEMVVIPPGSFMMGSTAQERRWAIEAGFKEKWLKDEQPQHRVSIAYKFAVGIYEVTQAEWQSVMGTNPSRFKGDRIPVEHVSWNDAQEFVYRLSRKTGQAYRLSTEAEWEYAARAGTMTPFYFGNTISTDRANYNGNYIYGNGRKGQYKERTISVGSFPANRFGLHDMHGNVWEWVQDCYKNNYAEAPSDGSAVGKRHDSCNRVLRGGSWYDEPGDLRSAERDGNTAARRGDFIGFRVARTLIP